MIIWRLKLTKIEFFNDFYRRREVYFNKRKVIIKKCRSIILLKENNSKIASCWLYWQTDLELNLSPTLKMTGLDCLILILLLISNINLQLIIAKLWKDQTL